MAWSLPASQNFLKLLTSTREGAASVRGGYGRNDGRIFQSIFSQNGASVRTNPPNAILQTFTTSPGYLNISDPTMGYIFTPGPQTARHQLFLPDPNLEMPYTDQWSASYERQIPWDSAIRISYNGNHVNGTLKYNLDNLPKSPLDGPVTVVDHPNNAPAAGWPDLRGKVINAIAQDALCAGNGIPPQHQRARPRARCPCRSPITRSAPACLGRTSGGRIRVTPPTSSWRTAPSPGTRGCRSSG